MRHFSALLALYWARQGLSPPPVEEGGNVSRVAEVAPHDLPAALDRGAITPEQSAKFRALDDYGHRLARVTLAREPG